MKTTTAFTSLVVCASAAALAATAHAEPQKPLEGKDFAFKFTYDPADLHDAGRAEKLIVRLEQSVRRYCGASGARSNQERQNARTCIDATMADSMDKFGSTLLTQTYQSRAAG